MDCSEVEKNDLLHTFLTDGMQPADRAAFKAHVASCDHCRASLSLAASLRLPEVQPVPLRAVTRQVEEPTGWRVLLGRLSSLDLGVWRPAGAFVAVLLISLPLSQKIWSPTEPELAQTTMRGSSTTQPRPLETLVADAEAALSKGNHDQAHALLADVGTANGSDDVLYQAYRVRARSSYRLNLKAEALQDLARAGRYVMDDERVACLQQDIKAIEQGNPDLFCPLPTR